MLSKKDKENMERMGFQIRELETRVAQEVGKCKAYEYVIDTMFKKDENLEI